MKHYEKPAMNFVSLRNENTVAKTCWGHHGDGVTMYCDIPGQGYCSFQIAEGPCALNLVNVKYHEGKEDETGTDIIDGDARHEELESILVKAGGNAGTSFKGEGDIVFPNNPDPTWS